MAGQSSHSEGLRPLDMMEGFSAPEVFRHLMKVDDVLQKAFGPDAEIKVVALSFLLGQYLKTSRINIGQTFGLVTSAMEVEE